MRHLPFLCMLVLVSGCAGTMFDGRVCTIATNDQIGELSRNVVDSYVDKNDRIKADMYLATGKLTATALCEMARAREVPQP